ncbi:MFS transporter [Bacillus cereus]
MQNKIKNIQIGTEETIRYISTEILMLLIPIIGINVLALNNSSIAIAASLASMGYLLFGYISGLIADKWNRQYIITTTLLINSLVFGLFSYLTLSANLTKESYFIIILLLSLCLVVIETTMTTWMPDIYTNKELSSINGLIQFARSSANLIGPALGGICIGILGETYTLLCISICLIVSCITIITIKGPKKKQNKNIQEKKVVNKKSTRIENLKYIFKNNILRTLVFTTGTINFAISMYTAIVVIFLVKDLNLSTSLTGILMSLSGIGAIIGSFLAPKLINKFGVIKVMVFAPIIPSCGLLLASFAKGEPGIIIFVIGTILFFISRSIGSIARVTIQQIVLPSHIRGEISGSMMMMTWGTIPLGALFAGILSDIIGVQSVLTVAGILLIVSNIWMLNKKIINLKDEQLENKIVS